MAIISFESINVSIAFIKYHCPIVTIMVGIIEEFVVVLNGNEHYIIITSEKNI